MIATFGDLIADIETFLNSTVGWQDKITVLTNPITASDLGPFPLADPSQVDRGVLQIGDELCQVGSVDRTNGTVTILPGGRGVRGTQAVGHSAGETVVSNPRWPRSLIKNEANNTILSLYPDLFYVKQAPSVNTSVTKLAYDVPVDCEGIVEVRFLSLGVPKWYVPVRRYRFERTYATGKAVTIFEPMPPGRPLQITYRASFLPFSDESAQLEGQGVSQRWTDLIRMGVASKLLLSVEPARLGMDSVEAGQRAQFVQPGAASNIAKNLMQLYKLRMKDERDYLLRQYPASVVIQA